MLDSCSSFRFLCNFSLLISFSKTVDSYYVSVCNCAQKIGCMKLVMRIYPLLHLILWPGITGHIVAAVSDISLEN